MNLGLYIHIPFCRKKCDYCSFYSIPLADYINTSENNYIENYIDILLIEVKERSSEFKDYIVDTIYIGGGTPSLMTPAQLNKILSAIHTLFKLENNLEITIEYNPDDFSIEKIKEYINLGINRIVLGMQTMNTRLHSILGRSACVCSKKMLSDFAGIPDISHCVDIITGIPGQTENELLKELSEIAYYRFEHISAYILSIEPNTPLFKKNISSPGLNNIQRILLESTINFLVNAGYSHYEVSNYALPFYESKHNMKYWKFLPYAGFGPAAHSFYKGKRFYNRNSVEEYIKHRGSILQKDERTKKSEIVEYIFSGLRLAEGISINDFENKLSLKIPKKLYDKFIELKKKHLLDVEDSNNDTIIRFTGSGFFQMDGLIYEIVEMFL
jgi:oxygen-independent coproporphyrinogen III oxidase